MIESQSKNMKLQKTGKDSLFVFYHCHHRGKRVEITWNAENQSIVSIIFGQLQRSHQLTSYFYQ